MATPPGLYLLFTRCSILCANLLFSKDVGPIGLGTTQLQFGLSSTNYMCNNAISK